MVVISLHSHAHTHIQVGYAVTTYDQADPRTPVIGFDMGGTSTDVSRYDGEYEHVFESMTAGVCIQAPQVIYHMTCLVPQVMSCDNHVTCQHCHKFICP